MAYTDLLKYLNYITDPVPGSYGLTKVRTCATQYNRGFGNVLSLIKNVIFLIAVIDFIYLTRLKGDEGERAKVLTHVSQVYLFAAAVGLFTLKTLIFLSGGCFLKRFVVGRSKPTRAHKLENI